MPGLKNSLGKSACIWSACFYRRRRRCRSARRAPAGGFGQPGREPSSDGNRRFHRPRRRIDKVDVVARVAGFIEQRNFTEGQMVKTGDLLFRIEQDTYKAAVDQQAANVAKAKATEVNANLQLQRAQALVKNQNVPQSEVDQLAAVEQSAQADILQAQALLEQAKINLGYTEIRSPINGRIGIANFTVGNLVSPSTGTLATIVSQDPIYVIFQASEADIIAYRKRVADSPDKDPHVTVHIRLPDGTEYAHPGLTNFLDVQVQSRYRHRSGAGAIP